MALQRPKCWVWRAQTRRLKLDQEQQGERMGVSSVMEDGWAGSTERRCKEAGPALICTARCALCLHRL